MSGQTDALHELGKMVGDFASADRLVELVNIVALVDRMEDYRWSVIYEPAERRWYVYRNYDAVFGLQASDRIGRGKTLTGALLDASRWRKGSRSQSG